MKDKQHCFDLVEMIRLGINYQSQELFTVGFN